MEQIKIGLISDVHSNLPALEAMLAEFNKQGCDEVIHTGDAIAMGAFPKECLDLLYAKNVTMLKGNHELLYLVGIDNLRFPMKTDEGNHHRQIHQMIGEDYREKIKAQPFEIFRNIFGKKVVFCHYAMHDGRYYRPIIKPSVDQLDAIFRYMDADVIFFGHEHNPLILQGEKLYVDIGSLGCNHEETANGVILTASKDVFDVKHIKVPYDKQKLFDGMQQRNIIRGDFISAQFFGKK